MCEKSPVLQCCRGWITFELWLEGSRNHLSMTLIWKLWATITFTWSSFWNCELCFSSSSSLASRSKSSSFLLKKSKRSRFHLLNSVVQSAIVRRYIPIVLIVLFVSPVPRQLVGSFFRYRWLYIYHLQNIYLNFDNWITNSKITSAYFDTLPL